MKLSKNFSSNELQCPCCQRCKMEPYFVEKLQELRNDFNKPITVTSGYRCKSHNKKIRGAKESEHLFGNAVDIACDNMFDRFELVKLAFKHGFTGIEISPKHVHIDLRPTTSRLMWTDFKTIA